MSNGDRLYQCHVLYRIVLFSTPKTKGVSKGKIQLAALKIDCSLFSRLYIACQSRDGKLEQFFEHENQPWPPSLSLGGKHREGTKSDLLICFDKISKSAANVPEVDMKVIDGAAVVHMLSPGTSKTFLEYATTIFLPYIESQLRTVQILNLVTDVYRPANLKQSTRESRGTGQRRHVEPSIAMPVNWKTFLRVDELFQLLAQQVKSLHVAGNNIITTDGEHIQCSPEDVVTIGIQPCSHEETDTRILLHVSDGLKHGYQKILIRTVDTDAVVLDVACMQYTNVLEL